MTAYRAYFKYFIWQYIYIWLTICALQKSHVHNLIYYLKSFLLIDFCFLLVCMNHSCQLSFAYCLIACYIRLMCLCMSNICFTTPDYLGDNFGNTVGLKWDPRSPEWLQAPRLEEVPNLEVGISKIFACHVTSSLFISIKIKRRF